MFSIGLTGGIGSGKTHGGGHVRRARRAARSTPMLIAHQHHGAARGVAMPAHRERIRRVDFVAADGSLDRAPHARARLQPTTRRTPAPRSASPIR